MSMLYERIGCIHYQMRECYYHTKIHENINVTIHSRPYTETERFKQAYGRI